MARKKKASIWDNRPLSDLMPKKMGGYSIGQTKSGAPPDSMVSRAEDSGADSYERVLGAHFPWDDSLEAGQVTSNLVEHKFSATDLNKMGFVIQDRSMDQGEIEAKEVLLGKRTGRRTHVVVAGTSKDPIYELWFQRYADASEGLSLSSPTNDMVVRTAAEKTKRVVIPKHIKKIAWEVAERTGVLDSMKHVGFDIYEASNEPGGVWWKQEFSDPDTGESKYYLVKREGVESAKDVGDKRVAAVNAAVKRKVVKKIASKVAVTQNDKNESSKEEAKETPASKITGVGSKVVELEGSGWKKEIDDYLKECEDNGFKPNKMEVKVVDWEPGNA